MKSTSTTLPFTRYLNWNLLQADRMTAVLMAPIWLSHVPLISITHRAVFNISWSSLDTDICDNTCLTKSIH